MKRIAFTNSTAHPLSWLPVMIPLMALVAMTGVVRIGSEVATLVRSGNHGTTAPYTPLSTNHFNSTESTFATYEKADQMSLAGQDTAALALLTSLASTPICMDGNAFHASDLYGFSPTSLMLGLANTMKRRIDMATAQGDVETAHRYVDALYRIGDHLAATRTPTISSVKTAHNFHSMAAQLDASLMPPANGNSNLAMRYEIATLRTFWEKQIAPQLTGSPAEDNVPERNLAARLSREYEDEWTRIRAGEA